MVDNDALMLQETHCDDHDASMTRERVSRGRTGASGSMLLDGTAGGVMTLAIEVDGRCRAFDDRRSARPHSLCPMVFPCVGLSLEPHQHS